MLVMKLIIIYIYDKKSCLVKFGLALLGANYHASCGATHASEQQLAQTYASGNLFEGLKAKESEDR